MEGARRRAKSVNAVTSTESAFQVIRRPLTVRSLCFSLAGDSFPRSKRLRTYIQYYACFSGFMSLVVEMY
jgi:hypothetical protein